MEIIDVVPDKFIWTVKWLHYLNYESIPCSSSTRILVCARNVLGKTVSSYGWCNGIPCVVLLFILFSERFMSDRISYQREDSLPHADIHFSSFRERLRVWLSFLQRVSHVLSQLYVLRYCFGICVYVRTFDIITPLQNSTILCDYNHMYWRDYNHMDGREHSIGPFVRDHMINFN